MPPTRHRARTLAIVALLALAACDERDAAPAPDTGTSVVTPPALPPATATATLGWDENAGGRALFINQGNGALAIVVPTVTDSTFSDTALYRDIAIANAEVELFDRTGRTGRVRLPATAAVPAPGETEGCLAWPELRVGGGPMTGSVGFLAGHAEPVTVEPIERLARADSARRAVDVARLASQIPNDTAAAFAGLPFVVQAAYRIADFGGVDVLVAEVVRRIGQEANPREQHIVLVAERPVGSSAPYVVKWHQRASGAEDAVETRELVTAVRLGPQRVPSLLLMVTYLDGANHELVERVDGAWRTRWTSAYTGC